MTDTADIHPLNRIFGECSSRALDGKGKAHHGGNGEPFTEQVWSEIAKREVDFFLGQIIKKAYQVDRMLKDGQVAAAREELKDIPVYAAMKMLAIDNIEKETRV